MKKLLYLLSSSLFVGAGIFNATSCGIIQGKVTAEVKASVLNTFIKTDTNFTFNTQGATGATSPYVPVGDFSNISLKSIINSDKNKLFAYVPSKKVSFSPNKAIYAMFREKIAHLIKWDESKNYTNTDKFNFVHNDQNLKFEIIDDATKKPVAISDNQVNQGSYTMQLTVAKKTGAYKETYLTPGTYKSEAGAPVVLYDLAPKTTADKLQFKTPAPTEKKLWANNVKTVNIKTPEDGHWLSPVVKAANVQLYKQTQSVLNNKTKKGEKAENLENIYNNIAIHDTEVKMEKKPTNNGKSYPFDLNDLNQEGLMSKVYYNSGTIINPNSPFGELDPAFTGAGAGYYLFKYIVNDSNYITSTDSSFWFEVHITTSTS